MKALNEYLVKQLREGRINKNLKQSDVATRIGVKGGTLSNYENGVSEPTIDTFAALCEIYDLDFAEILETAYGTNSSKNNFQILYSEKELLKRYRVLDSYGKELVESVLNKELDRCVSKYCSTTRQYFPLSNNPDITYVSYRNDFAEEFFMRKPTGNFFYLDDIIDFLNGSLTQDELNAKAKSKSDIDSTFTILDTLTKSQTSAPILNAAHEWDETKATDETKKPQI